MLLEAVLVVFRLKKLLILPKSVLKEKKIGDFFLW